MTSKPRSVAVLIVCHNGLEVIPACIESLRRADYSEIECRIWILENASSDDSRQYLDDLFSPAPDDEDALHIRIIKSDINRGFAGGNNLLWEYVNANQPELSYLYLLNQDTEVQADFLKRGLDYMEKHPAAGCAQSLLMLDPERERINTAGNISHYLGFGLPSHYREVLQEGHRAELDGEIGYPSGASVLIDAALVRQVGLFQSEMFLYLEDADLGWKLRQLGRPPHTCADSIVYHKYRFHENFKFYELLERNRLWLLLVYYRIGTLVVLFPAIVFMELGQTLFAISKGLLAKKFAAYSFFLMPSNVQLIFRLRREAAARRRISDHEFLRGMSSQIDSPHLTSPLLKYIGSPVLQFYFWFSKKIIVW